METSAKTAANVNELFVAIAKKLPKLNQQNARSSSRIVQPGKEGNNNGKSTDDKKKQSGGGCCS